MFFGTRNPNLWSILKPGVELMVFLRMRSDKITKNGEQCHEDAVLRNNFSCIYVFWYEESESVVHFETGTRNKGVSAHAQQ